jgi:hypothetical protein
MAPREIEPKVTPAAPQSFALTTDQRMKGALGTVSR